MDHVHNGGPWRLSVYGRSVAMASSEAHRAHALGCSSALEPVVRGWRARGEHGDPHRRQHGALGWHNSANDGEG
jgi:hypothetical protein